MNQVMFSIIIPCYKRYDVITECLPRLERQTSKDFEVIVIDDCSDNSLYEDLLKYRETSVINIHVYRNDINLGPGKTRTKGIEYATGDYVVFVDSDDYIRDDAIELLSEMAEKTTADCIYFDFCKVVGGRHTSHHSYYKDVQFIDKKEALLRANTSTCSKIFKTQLLKQNNISFADVPRGEDFAYTKLALAECESIAYLREELYFYVDTKESLMKVNQSGTYAKELYDFIEKHWKHEELKEELDDIYIHLMAFIYMQNLVANRADKHILEKQFRQINDKCPGWYNEKKINTMPRYRKIVYRLVNKKQWFLLKVMVRLKFLVKGLS